MPQHADVIVVGAGHNGLVAACYLARAGLDVLVVEGSPTVGGMTSTNPTIPGAPDHLVNEGAIEASLILTSSIARDLQLERHGLKRLTIEVPHVQLGPDGSSIALWRDARRTADEIRRYSPHDADAWLDLARTLDTAMDVLLPYMLTHPTRPALRNLLSAASGAMRHPRQLAPLGRFITASLAEVIDERFEHPLTRGVLASVAPFSWVTQDSTGWALIYLGLIQRISPARFEGGTGALPDALYRCLLAHGGRVRTGALVDELVVRSGQVCGVRLANGEEIEARAVIASCSPKTTLTRLLPDGLLPEHLARRARHIPTATAEGGHLKINVALRGRLSLPRHEAARGDGLDLRRPLLTWSTLEDCIAAWESVVARQWPARIPVMCTVPTAIDPTQAPRGQDTFWLWSGIVPVRPHEPWETARDRIANEVLADCATYYDGLESLEIGRTVLSTPDLEERFHAIDGNVYHVDSVLQRFGPLRPAAGFGSYATPVPGLFLERGGHPSHRRDLRDSGAAGSAGRDAQPQEGTAPAAEHRDPGISTGGARRHPTGQRRVASRGPRAGGSRRASPRQQRRMTVPIATHPPQADLILPLPADGERWDPHTVHTHYFGLSVPEARIGAFIYIRYQPAFPLSQGGVCIFQGMDNLSATDIEFLDYQMTMPWPEVAGNTITTANGLRIEFLEPGRTARVTFTSNDGSTSFDVIQTGVTPLLARGHVIPGEELSSDPSLNPGGSEQFMHCTGELTLNGERHAVDCHYPRDRSWRQVRTERQGGAVPIPPIGWTPMYFGEDLVFNQVGFEAPDTDPAWKGLYQVPADRPTHHYAWVCSNGEVRSITRVRRDVLRYHPELHNAIEQVVEAEDERGRTYRFRGEAIATAALPAWPNLSFRDSVYRWEDEQGRVTHSTYQEIWSDRYQRAMKARSRVAVGV